MPRKLNPRRNRPPHDRNCPGGCGGTAFVYPEAPGLGGRPQVQPCTGEASAEKQGPPPFIDDKSKAAGDREGNA